MIKKSTGTKVAASIFAAAMGMCGAMPAMASPNYTPVKGGDMYFGKYLIMDQEANVPPVTFTYTIAAGTAQTYNLGNRKFEVLAGVTPENVKFSNTPEATFTVGQQTFTTPQTGTNIKDTANAAVVDQVELTTGQKYARAEVKVDFSGVSFDEPGVYRYKLSETQSPASYVGIKNDEAADRIIDVYVTDNNGALEIAGYVMHSTSDDITMSQTNGTDGTNPAGKSKGYNNNYITHDLTFSKSVSGNQASKDKYFKFDVVITGALPGTKFDVSGITGSNPTADATVGTNSATLPAYRGQSNPTTLEAGADGSVTQSFYLSHGQSLTINGIPDTVKYSVTESKEDYKPAVTITGDTEATQAEADTTLKVDDTQSGITADTTDAFVNTREGIVPTGIIMTVAPYATVVLIGGVGATLMMRKKDEE